MTQMREAMREAGIRENLREEPARLVRRRGMTSDKFYVPEELKKPELSYEWKRETTMGQRDTEHQVDLASNHWRAVPATDMPGMMPADHTGTINRGGMVLMSRPKYLTEEATQEILDMANERIYTNSRRLGQSAPDQLPRTAPKVNRDYVPPSEGERRMMESRMTRRDAIPT